MKAREIWRIGWRQLRINEIDHLPNQSGAMSQLSYTLISLLKDISKRPQMFANTPESAHGLMEGISWILFCDSFEMPIERCMNEVSSLIRQVTAQVHKSDIVPIMLCDEPFPDRVSSFETFRSHSQQFIERLEERLATSKETHLPSES